MNKLSKEKRDQLILVVMLTLAVVGGLWWFLISAQQAMLRDKKDKIQKVNSMYEDATTAMKSKEFVNQDLLARLEKLRSVEFAMAYTNDFRFWIITNFKSFTMNYAFGLIPDQLVAGRDYDMFPAFPYQMATFNYSGKASYHDLGKFISNFENAYPYFRFKNLTLTQLQVENPQDAGMIKFDVDVVVLVQPPGMPR